MEERRASEIQLAEFRAEFKAFVARFDERDKRLFGNGQPGILDKHQARLDAHEDRMNFVRGALWVIGGLLTLFGGTVVAHIALSVK